jgi:hypothetical protein
MAEDAEHFEIMARCPNLPALYKARCEPASISWEELPNDMRELIAAGYMLAYYEMQQRNEGFSYDEAGHGG